MSCAARLTSQYTSKMITVKNVENNKKKVNQSYYKPEVSRGFQEAKVPRLREIGSGWW